MRLKETSTKSKWAKRIVAPVLAFSMLLSTAFISAEVLQNHYTVKSGDSLFTISRFHNVSIDYLKVLNNIIGDTIFIGQVLKLEPDHVGYTVRSGDTLWLIAQRYGLTVDGISQMNKLQSTSLFVGQVLKLDAKIAHVVRSGESLWLISQRYGITVDQLRSANALTGDALSVGQTLLIPKTQTGTQPGAQPAPQPTPQPTLTPAPTPTPTPVATATVFYTVLAGDTVTSIANKLGTTASDIIRFNYMSPDQWLNAGQRIAINGFAPRNYTVKPGEATAPARVGKLVDWYLEGQYLLKRNDVFTVVDVLTGTQFKVKMIGGYNHVDVETLTPEDTAIMHGLFNNRWQWSPRAVVVFKDGMNIAASLSGMPHSFDVIPGNNMTGHCDIYLLNSRPHGSDVSQSYVAEHHTMVRRAAGQQ